MSDTLTTDVVEGSFAKDLGKVALVGAAQTAAAYAGAVAVIVVAGTIYNKIEKRRAKKALTTEEK